MVRSLHAEAVQGLGHQAMRGAVMAAGAEVGLHILEGDGAVEDLDHVSAHFPSAVFLDLAEQLFRHRQRTGPRRAAVEEDLGAAVHRQPHILHHLPGVEFDAQHLAGDGATPAGRRPPGRGTG